MGIQGTPLGAPENKYMKNDRGGTGSTSSSTVRKELMTTFLGNQWIKYSLRCRPDIIVCCIQQQLTSH